MRVDLDLADVPQESPYQVRTLVEEIPLVDTETVAEMGTILGEGGKAQLVSEMTASDLEDLSPGVRKALNYSGSVIVDAGPGIGALVDARPRAEQAFSDSDVNAAIVEAGLVKEGEHVLKFGAAGSVMDVDRARGIEVIGADLLTIRNGMARVGVLARGAWSGEDGLHIDALGSDHDERVLLENMALVTKQERTKSKAVLLTIEGDDETEIYDLVFQAAEAAGWKNWSVRGSMFGPGHTDNAVIDSLPEEEITSLQMVGECLVKHSAAQSATYQFMGSKTGEVSRQNEKWGELTGNNVYSPKGHIHGYSTDGSVGGHCLKLIPSKGTKVCVIIEPAKVTHLVKKAA